MRVNITGKHSFPVEGSNNGDVPGQVDRPLGAKGRVGSAYDPPCPLRRAVGIGAIRLPGVFRSCRTGIADVLRFCPRAASLSGPLG